MVQKSAFQECNREHFSISISVEHNFHYVVQVYIDQLIGSITKKGVKRANLLKRKLNSILILCSTAIISFDLIIIYKWSMQSKNSVLIPHKSVSLKKNVNAACMDLVLSLYVCRVPGMVGTWQ